MRTTFLLERVIGDQRLDWQARATCLVCGEPFMVRRGQHTATLRAGRELVGLVCDTCLDDGTLERLAVLRGEAVTK